MRKFIKYLACVCLILCTIFMCVSCKHEVDEDALLKNNKGDVIEGLSAYEIVSTAYIKWQKEELGDHKRVEVLDFVATALGGAIVASRYETQEYTVKGENAYSTKWAYNTGLAGKNNGSKYKVEDGEVYLLEVDKSVVVGKKDEMQPVSWPDSVGNKIVDAEEKEELHKRFRKMSTTYDLSKKEYLTNDSDDAVYKFAPNENYIICTLTIDMSDAAMKNQQKVAKEEFVNALGCKPDSLKMHLVDFTVVLEKLNNEYRIIKWQFIEDYEGVAGVTANAYQTYTATFEYNV